MDLLQGKLAMHEEDKNGATLLLILSQKPGRLQSYWKYSNVWAYVWLALLGINEPKEVISTICMYSFLLSE